MNLTVRIERYNAETDKAPYTQDYQVTAEPTDRVLDVLVGIKRGQDGTLGVRFSCAHGVCGSDAMRINGKERLACKTLLQDVAEKDGDTVEIQPLQNVPVERDLIIDQTVLMDKYRQVDPFLKVKDDLPMAPGNDLSEGEYLQSPEEHALIEDATKCIMCGACNSACPVMKTNPAFIGPSAIVQAVRFVNDSRDQGLESRLDVLDDPNGVWSCDNHFECTRVCPRGIKITKLINQTKRQIKKYREGQANAKG